MIADPMAAYAAQPQPMYYSEPTCGYVEPGCGYMGNMVSYGPSMPVDMGGCCGDGGCVSGCCGETSYDPGAVISTPTESFVDPTPAAE